MEMSRYSFRQFRLITTKQARCVQVVFFVPYFSLAAKGSNTTDDVFSAGKTMVRLLSMP